MQFDKKIYKKKYFVKAIKDVQQDFRVVIKWVEKGNYFEIEDINYAIKVADYYIYVYNESN